MEITSPRKQLSSLYKFLAWESEHLVYKTDRSPRAIYRVYGKKNKKKGGTQSENELVA